MDFKELAISLYNELYGNKPFATEMHNMFSDNIEYMWTYVQVGRQFWDYNDLTARYELITITYKRSGVAFYITDSDETEHYILKGSAHLGLLYPRIIYAEDLKQYAKECYGYSEEQVNDMLTTLKPATPADNVQIDVQF